MWHVRKTAEVHKVFWWGGLRERDLLEDVGVEGRIKLKWVFEKWDKETWTLLICHRVRSGEGVFNAVLKLWVP
jgi:hypothetical protein